MTANARIVTIRRPKITTQYLTGPNGGPRRCIICRAPFEEGEHWLKMTRVGEYSIGAHTSCLARNGHELDGAIVSERF